MTISSKLPDSLKKQERGKQTPKDSFSKLLGEKQKKLLKNEDANLPENPIWAPNLLLSPEKKPDLSTILSTKISEVELSTNAPVTSHFPIEIEELWEKLGSACILMNHSQDKETTFILDTNTLFSGMRITIKEYSTAPKIFNIELAPTSSTALSLIASHVPQLLNRFRQESFGFSINNIIPELQSYETTAHQKQDDEDSQ
ncbi:hypothetical protein RHABOEDO_001582 [Candidatus Rhabdochlamydia oedothoracis]|uniref:Uncharacterized protein n=1 Tax=Candidatus Rhabdochlamydia oedothoracis TaxID=2720720 RepID=A0ABX8V329_9BACT|nr:MULTISPECIES: hypothetical protein [Rhabdochlamydia]KAG6559441.1 hypothetical protein RHOW815_000562 [Candidatus Rhabdochlamydia sp. W815]MCL6755874.1 hypothetical protein [Candidatus Rhabdochlamydia oedothoracis]QYF49276.1 hypothetical protein RHABOEDO_001582 [Candidatus Rhabdochlamydia oedothoracis]